MDHPIDLPSPWVVRWSHLVPAGGSVLDVACGSGRHTHWFSERGHPVTAVDRNETAVAALRPIAEVHVADLEHGPWPFEGRPFDGVIVTNYLWRALLPRLVAAVKPGGALIYETFGVGQETVGRPSNPNFLLQPGELLQSVQGAFRVVAYEDGFLNAPPRFVQRIAAVRLPAGSAPDGAPPRFLL